MYENIRTLHQVMKKEFDAKIETAAGFDVDLNIN